MSTNNPEYQKEYDAKYSVQLKLRLSRKYDADILEHLGKVGNKQGYIKDLIREDMRRNGKMKLYYVTAIKGDDEFLVAKTADAD